MGKALKWLEEMLTDVETETGFAYSEGQCMSNNKVFSNYLTAFPLFQIKDSN